MKIKTHGFTLKLTLEEAKLLKGMVQNPMWSDEDLKSYNLRKAIWDILDDQGVRIDGA